MLLLALFTGLTGSGCVGAARSSLPIKAEDNTARLLLHPQFQRAAAAAPDFVREALRTITRLEKEKADAGIP